MTREWRRGDYLISTDASQLDLKVVHGFLETAYWSPHVPFETVKRAIFPIRNCKASAAGCWRRGMRMSFIADLDSRS